MKLYNRHRILTITFIIVTSFVFLTKSDFYFYFINQILWNRTFISHAKASKKWGRNSFDSKIFREGKFIWGNEPQNKNFEKRSGMVADLIQKRTLIGTPYKDIEKLLGPRDGDYFDQDSILSYRIFIKMDDNKIIEAYDLILIPSENGKVDKVLIWKSR